MVGRSPSAQGDPADIARVFTRGTYRALGAPQTFGARDAARTLADTVPVPAHTTLGEGFGHAMQHLVKSYRNEYVFKNFLVERLIFGRHSPKTASALLELRAGSSIADVVLFNGTSSAYEIKTDLDGLSRLARQVADYSCHFEQVFVVTTHRMAPRILNATPPHIGVLALTDRSHLSTARPASAGLCRMSATALFGLLHRGEALRVLQRTMGYEADVPVSRLWHRTRDLFAELAIDVAHAEVVTELRRRGMSSAPAATSVPASLRALAYEVPSSASAMQRMHGRLSMPIEVLAS